jgi:hypothetical protein
VTNPNVRDSDVGAAWFQAAQQLMADLADCQQRQAEVMAQLNELRKLGPALGDYTEQHLIPMLEAAARRQLGVDSALVAELRAQLSADLRAAIEPRLTEIERRIGNK